MRNFYEQRKTTLLALPEILQENFGFDYDDIAISGNAKDDVFQVVIPHYRRLLDIATSISTETLVEEEWQVVENLHEYEDYPLPPYDEVILCPGTNEIRLIQLLPGQHNDTIMCNIFQVDSTSLYEYEAVSYVWGSTKDPRPIYVNEWEMPVTANLETILRDLRDEEEPRILWIDAICINQLSIREKSNQVSRMGRIYSDAKRVLVFLGPPDEASDQVCGFLEHGYDALSDIDQDDEKPQAFGLEAAAYLIEHHLSLVQAFIDVIFRPWFSRSWVRQEYIRAEELPRFYFGRHNLDLNLDRFNMLCEAVLLLPTLLKQPLSDVVDSREFHEVFARTAAVSQFMNSNKQFPAEISFWLDNETTSGWQATDSRDLIFSMCGLLDFVARHVLEADYSQSIEEAFTRASAWMLMVEQAPSLWVQYPPLKGRGTPSWVVDFTKSRPTSKHHEFVATFDDNIFDLEEEEEEEEEEEGHGGDEEENSKNDEEQDREEEDRDIKEDDEASDDPNNNKPHTDTKIIEESNEHDFKTPTRQTSNGSIQVVNMPIASYLELYDIEKEEANDDHFDDDLDCSIFQRTLSISGFEMATIDQVYEISGAMSRIETIGRLWHLEKLFQSTSHTESNTNILQWAVKIPISHRISSLIPHSEYFLEFLSRELEPFIGVEAMAADLLEDLLGALLFDHQRFTSEFKTISSKLPSPTEADTPRYSTLISHLQTSTPQANHANLLTRLNNLATTTLPHLLHTPFPHTSPQPYTSLPSPPPSPKPFNPIDSSSYPTLPTLPRTSTDLIQAWENERADIYAQLFHSCCFFQTSDNTPGLGAFGLSGLEKGDRIAWLTGVPMPMVLRSCGGSGGESGSEEDEDDDEEEERWRIVGPVVVKGMMDREVKDLIRSKGLEDKRFYIV